MQQPSKTALQRLHRRSAAASASSSPHSSPQQARKGSKRRPDHNDYSIKHQLAPMYIRDERHPFVHFRLPYSSQLDVWLTEQCPSPDPAHPPRYSAIRTTSHPTHRILGHDVRLFYMIKDSGFDYVKRL